MQKNENESNECPTTTTPDTARGLDKDTDRIKFEIKNAAWPTPPAFFFSFLVEHHATESTKGAIHWYTVRISDLRLSVQAALLAIQGLSLSKLFEGSSIPCIPEERFCSDYLLLKGSYSPFVVPPKLTDVVLARAYVMPEGMTEEELKGELLSALFDTTTNL